MHVSAQKYSVQSFNVEDGLVQSQPVALMEDAEHHLWIATLGGVSRFDSKKFTNLTHFDGLLSNYTTALLTDRFDRVWIGSQLGLSLFNGKQFINYPLARSGTASSVKHIVSMKDGSVLFIYAGNVYHAGLNFCRKMTIPSQREKVTGLAKDHAGNILAVIHNQGLYRYDHQTWKVIDTSASSLLRQVRISKIYTGQNGKIWFLSDKGLIEGANNKYSWYQGPFANKIELPILSIHETKKGILWLGTPKGVYRISAHTFQHFTAAEGFTDQPVMDIGEDHENGVWLAINAGGIMRFSDDKITFLDQSSGLPNPIVLGFAEDNKGRLWMGTYGSGVAYYDQEKIVTQLLPSKNVKAQTVNFMFADQRGHIWVGTNGGGVWQQNDQLFVNVTERSGIKEQSYLCATMDRSGTLYFGTPSGIYFTNGNKLVQLNGINSYVTALSISNAGELVIGTAAGVYLYRSGKVIPYTTDSTILTAAVFSIVQSGKAMVFGTANMGVFVDPDGQGKKLYPINTRHGLSSNTVYSMVEGKPGELWVGTGYYITQLLFDQNHRLLSTRIYDRKNGIHAAEANQNSAFKDQKGNIWMGTNGGAYCIRTSNDTAATTIAPKVFLQSVHLFSQPFSDTSYYEGLFGYYPVPKKLKLPYHKNHLTFDFQGISYSSPSGVRYQYYLEGLDKTFLPPVSNNSVVYSAIPPGKYTFKVRALLDHTPQNIGAYVAYPFEVEAPFYQSWFFQFLAVLFLILTGVLIQWWRGKIKQKKEQMIRDLRKEEQYKVRKRTAEDFHDEMGNKLTRISVLTDIVKSKLRDDKEILKLIGQIRDNAMTLYSGTKDIIWSLHPESDNLNEILMRIRNFGVELFQETDTDFTFQISGDTMKDIRLPIDYSRNLMMICKESLNNALKHSDCTKVKFHAVFTLPNALTIQISDNGKGVDVTAPRMGQGIDNMKIRAKRIQANLEILSDTTNPGTCITLQMEIPL